MSCQTKILKSLENIIEYNWKDEMKDFCESFEIEIQSQDSLEDWIETCEKSKTMMKHIFYDLMIIKNQYFNE